LFTARADKIDAQKTGAAKAVNVDIENLEKPVIASEYGN
jgi:hypothetical protein